MGSGANINSGGAARGGNMGGRMGNAGKMGGAGKMGSAGKMGNAGKMGSSAGSKMGNTGSKMGSAGKIGGSGLNSTSAGSKMGSAGSKMGSSGSKTGSSGLKIGSGMNMIPTEGMNMIPSEGRSQLMGGMESAGAVTVHGTEGSKNAAGRLTGGKGSIGIRGMMGSIRPGAQTVNMEKGNNGKLSSNKAPGNLRAGKKSKINISKAPDRPSDGKENKAKEAHNQSLDKKKPTVPRVLVNGKKQVLHPSSQRISHVGANHQPEKGSIDKKPPKAKKPPNSTASTIGKGNSKHDLKQPKQVKTGGKQSSKTAGKLPQSKLPQIREQQQGREKRPSIAIYTPSEESASKDSRREKTEDLSRRKEIEELDVQELFDEMKERKEEEKKKKQ